MRWLTGPIAVALVVAACGTTATRTASGTPTAASASPAASPSSMPGPAVADPIQTPPPGEPGRFALEFHLKIVGSVDPGDRFDVAFHPPTSNSGNEATFALCPSESPGGGSASGPCGIGKTFVEGGGFQPAGSSILYRFTHTSTDATQIIAQGTMTLTTNTALVVTYPSG